MGYDVNKKSIVNQFVGAVIIQQWEQFGPVQISSDNSGLEIQKILSGEIFPRVVPPLLFIFF